VCECRDTVRRTIRGEPVGVSDVDWSTKGELLVNYRPGDICMFDTRTYTAITVREIELCSQVVQSYKGRLNSETFAKEARFIFCDEGYVATGGDCGHIFIWDKKTGRLLRKMKSDRVIVNSIAPHPSLPLLASSGIDDDIKIWSVGETIHQRQLGQVPPSGKYDAEIIEEDTEPAETINLTARREAAPAIVTTDEARQRLEEGEKCKQQGNTSFRSGQCEDAVRHYTRATGVLSFVAPNRAIEQERKRLTTLCKLNEAACHLELGHYGMTIRRCTEVLAVDPHLVKALYRRARAHLESKDFDEAKKDVIRALDVTPNDTQLSKLLREVKKIQADEEAKEKRKFKAFFATEAKRSDHPEPVAALPRPSDDAEDDDDDMWVEFTPDGKMVVKPPPSGSSIIGQSDSSSGSGGATGSATSSPDQPPPADHDGASPESPTPSSPEKQPAAEMGSPERPTAATVRDVDYTPDPRAKGGKDKALEGEADTEGEEQSVSEGPSVPGV